MCILCPLCLFFGRNDKQIKLKGFRISEIENLVKNTKLRCTKKSKKKTSFTCSK